MEALMALAVKGFGAFLNGERRIHAAGDI